MPTAKLRTTSDIPNTPVLVFREAVPDRKAGRFRDERSPAVRRFLYLRETLRPPIVQGSHSNERIIYAMTFNPYWSEK